MHPVGSDFVSTLILMTTLTNSPMSYRERHLRILEKLGFRSTDF